MLQNLFPNTLPVPVAWNAHGYPQGVAYSQLLGLREKLALLMLSNAPQAKVCKEDITYHLGWPSSQNPCMEIYMYSNNLQKVTDL